MIEIMIAVPCPRCSGKGHLLIHGGGYTGFRPAYTEKRRCPRCDGDKKIGKAVPLESVLSCIKADHEIYSDTVQSLPLLLNEDMLQHELDRLSKAENATASEEQPDPGSSRPDRK